MTDLDDNPLLIVTSRERIAKSEIDLPISIRQFPVEQALGQNEKAWVRLAQEVGVVLVDWLPKTLNILSTVGPIARSQRTPIGVLCRRGAAGEVAALTAGADFTLTYPVSEAFLEAKLLAYERHQQLAVSGDGLAREPVLASSAPLLINDSAAECRVFGEVVQLTKKEFDLLIYLATEPGKIRSKEEILNAVWGLEFDPGSNVVSVVVCGLRKKLKEKGLPEAVKTIWGRGYRLLPFTVGGQELI